MMIVGVTQPLRRRCGTAPHSRRRAVCLSVLAWCAPTPVLAQTVDSAHIGRDSESFVHESWTVQEGLPVNSINALLQSHDGYLWIATFDGLVRFDGVRFTVFNSANSDGLPGNRIIDLHEAGDGALWLRTEQQALIRYQQGAFTHFGPERGLEHPLLELVEDPHGTLWLGTTGGLAVVRGERVEPVAAETVRGRVATLIARTDGTIWSALAGGSLYRIENGRTAAVVLESELGSEQVTTLHEDAAGTLWIGTDRGIWRHRDVPERVADARGVARLRTSPDSNELWVITGPGQGSRVFRLGPRGLVHVLDRAASRIDRELPFPDTSGRMLYYAGLELHRDGRPIYSLPPPGRGQPAENAGITAIALDHEGSLWLGTNIAGLHRLKPALFSVHPEPEALSHRSVYSVYEDRDGTIWIGTLTAGTYQLAAGRFSRLPPAAGYPLTAHSFLQDGAGRLWIGGGLGSGVSVCAPSALRCDRPSPDPIGGARVLAIHQDRDGALWFGSEAGLFRYQDGVWTRLNEADGAPTAPVRAFQQTGDGALWMGTRGGGLARYHEGRITHVTTSDGLPFDIIRSLHQDGDGWLWVGTEGRGLARLDPREWREGGGRIVTYRMRDGLFDEVIHQILEDDFGRLWMSTNRGIFWVERRELLAFANGRIPRINSTGYTERDGLRNREANGGSQPAGVRTRDGRLWFPTQDGVAVVDPARVQRNTIPPNVVIEQVTAAGRSLRPGDGDAPLELGVEQRDLEIEYTALSFLAPANVRFRYRLEPYDADWVDAGSRRTAYYTRVPPGQYTFRVLASNNDGVWNEAGTSLALQLAPRFYETRSFRVMSLLAIVALIGGAVLWRVRRLQTRTRQLARLVDDRTRELRAHQQQLAAQNAQLERQTEQLQELDSAKSRFFANISHEFRTPLTLILGPLRDMIDRRKETLADATPHQLEMMTRNAQRLLRLVNQILDLARLESGALALDRGPGDIVELARSAARSFTPLAERRGVSLSFHAEPERLVVELDTEQMEKVLLNLLSNAFKFTEPGGEVAVTVRRDPDSALVEVRDTGIGIAPDHLPHVFERFYQADASATRRHEGTGIGLSLARELVQLHGGSMAASSRPGEGSTFTVHLPLPVDLASASADQPGSATAGVPVAAASEDGRRAPPEDAVHAGAGVGEGRVAATPPEDEAEQTAVVESDGEDRTTVLVVDDNADIRAYVRSVLEPGFRIIEAGDGQVGLERAREQLPDLVIADVMMPRLDGLALTRALRDDPATDCIPTILLTARAGADDEMHGLGTGADDYIAKPFHAGVLEARVRGLIAGRRRLRERFREEGLPAPAVAPAPPRSDLEVRLRSILEENLTEPDFNPEALAAAAGLSYLQLYRRLADELDVTPSRFIRTVRVERAADLLRDGAGSITDVAYSVGFNSLSYFNRCFRERFDAPPSAVTRSPA